MGKTGKCCTVYNCNIQLFSRCIAMWYAMSWSLIKQTEMAWHCSDPKADLKISLLIQTDTEGLGDIVFSADRKRLTYMYVKSEW